MFGSRNPYAEIVQNLEAAYHACGEAMNDCGHLPTAKGGGDISHLAVAARNLLYEAVHTARQWQDSYEYHMQGTYGPRSDF